MTWKDDIREAAYTSNGGQRLTFQFEDVSTSFTKKGTVFQFPDSNETYVQELGSTGRSLPLRCIFSGADCNIQADKFEDAIRAKGVGILEHPMYGRFSVVPFGEVKRIDAIKTAANQTIIELTFFQTQGLIFTNDQRDPTTEIKADNSGYINAIVFEYAKTFNANSIGNRTDSKSYFETLKEDVQKQLAPIAAVTSSVQRQFAAIDRSIDNNFDLFLGDPLTLANQLVQLIQSPARSSALISEKLNTYSNMAKRIIRDGSDAINLLGDMLTFRTADLSTSSYVSGMVLSSINSSYDTRSKAVSAAEILIDQFSELSTWRDDNFQNLNGTSNVGEEVDVGESYQLLQKMIAQAAGYLVQLSFELVSERRIILTYERSLHDVVAEYYGDTDEKFDFFINTNNLSGTEIINLPAGKEIVIFV